MNRIQATALLLILALQHPVAVVRSGGGRTSRPSDVLL